MKILDTSGKSKNEGVVLVEWCYLCHHGIKFLWEGKWPSWLL